ncbi:hypothetical protein chiPu_0026772, partial [Chiloscyllium punctatum]|nr:hypothetical protein [Chiloscyllium punctatum]
MDGLGRRVFAPVIQLSQAGSYGPCRPHLEVTPRERARTEAEVTAYGGFRSLGAEPPDTKPRVEQARRGDVRFALAETAPAYDRKRRKAEEARPYPGHSVIAPLGRQGPGGGGLLVNPSSAAEPCPSPRAVPTSVTNVLRPVSSSGGTLPSSSSSSGLGLLYAPGQGDRKVPAAPQPVGYSPGETLVTGLVVSSPSVQPPVCVSAQPATTTTSSSSGLVLPQQPSLQFITQTPPAAVAAAPQNGALPLGIIQPQPQAQAQAQAQQQLKPATIAQLQYILPGLPPQLQLSPAGKVAPPQCGAGPASIHFTLPPSANGKLLAASSTTSHSIPIIQATPIVNPGGGQK